MAAALLPSAACALCAGTTAHGTRSGPAAASSRAQHIESLALSLVLHALLAVWASRNAPHFVERSARADSPEVEQFTISVTPDRRAERADEVALVVQETIPPPEVEAEAPPGEEAAASAAPPPPALVPAPEPALAKAPLSLPP